MTRDNAICILKQLEEIILEQNSFLTKTKNVVTESIDMAVEALKQPEQQWIPCSEKLPRYGESVLTWDGAAYCVEKRIPCIRDEHGEPIYSDWWVSDDYDEFDSEYYPNLRDGACIAWMPLPKGYSGE